MNIEGLMRHLLAACLIMLLTGCATTETQSPQDPLESVNRAVFSFNEGVDKAVIHPLAKGYKAITPEPVDQGITNFFANLSDIGSAINNLLQLKPTRALSDTGRVAVNTTIGIGGLFDVATRMGLEKTGEDFGQTLGYWGVPAGPYIVWPILGPSDLRDSVGKVGDWYMDPLNYAGTPDWPREWKYGITEDWQWGLWLVSYIDTRADLLNAEEVLDVAALDRYTYLRDAYLQHRQSLIDDNKGGAAADGSTDATTSDW